MPKNSTTGKDGATKAGAPQALQTQARRKALVDALKEHDLRPADIARLANLPQANSLYNFINGRTASLATSTWERLLPFLPKSDVGVLLGLTEPGGSAIDAAKKRHLQDAMRRRTIEQVVGHITEVRTGC